MSGGGVGKFRKLSTVNMKEVVCACELCVGLQHVCLAAIKEYREATHNTGSSGGSVFSEMERKTSQGRDSLMVS